MAQKAPILLYQEAQNSFVNTINYYLQQGLPIYDIKNIIDILNTDLIKLVEQETKQAQEAYQQALAAEEKANEENNNEKAE